ncbi:MAG: hypothetical protein AVDCRST_MAG67-1264, partial [uncultured Solirubrobacteraceae bacterium]
GLHRLSHHPVHHRPRRRRARAARPAGQGPDGARDDDPDRHRQLAVRRLHRARGLQPRSRISAGVHRRRARRVCHSPLARRRVDGSGRPARRPLL